MDYYRRKSYQMCTYKANSGSRLIFLPGGGKKTMYSRHYLHTIVSREINSVIKLGTQQKFKKSLFRTIDKE